MTAGPAHDLGPTGDNRAQAPIRWPKPDKFTLGLMAAWFVGLVIALGPVRDHVGTRRTV